MSDDATTRPAPRPEAEPSRSGSSAVLAVFLGGIVAGGIGYLAAYYTEFDLLGADQGADPLERVSATLEEQAQRLETLETLADEAPAAAAAPEMGGQLDEVANRLAAISERIEVIETAPGTDSEAREQAQAASASLTALQDRIAALEVQTGDPGVTETDASQSQQLADLNARVAELSQQVQSQAQVIDEQAGRLESQAKEIAAAQQAARSETNRISAQAALAEIRAAFDSGTPYADAIGQLQSTGSVEVPTALSEPAGSGVATLVSLRESFPQAARAALSESVAATAGDGPMDRFGAFLKAQTGARSLDEQEGTGPDAILSRAEARLRDGELEAALSELQALPEQGREAMSDWLSRARARLDAQAALADLSQTVTNI